MERLIGILQGLHPEIKGEMREELGGLLDSIDIVMLVTDLNDAYGIEIGAEEIRSENFSSLSSVASLVSRLGGELR